MFLELFVAHYFVCLSFGMYKIDKEIISEQTHLNGMNVIIFITHKDDLTYLIGNG